MGLVGQCFVAVGNDVELHGPANALKFASQKGAICRASTESSEITRIAESLGH